MDLFARRNIRSGKHKGQPQSRRINSVLDRLTGSKKAVELWGGGESGEDRSNPYEVAARALTAQLDRLPLDDRQQASDSRAPSASAGANPTSPPPRPSTAEAIVQRVKGGQLHAKLPYTELQAVTDDFSEANRLAGGGSCVVYKAELYGTAVAIKHLELCSAPGATEQHPDAGGEIQFSAECELLMRISHPAICRMLGFSVDGPQRCIVLELCVGGSLEDRLACEAVKGRARPPLPWEQRVRIALDMADALVYLHTLEPKPMLHRDVKTANCLLDEAGQAKVSGKRKQTR
jgi:interleukin-1 receptor-associated kinase 1